MGILKIFTRFTRVGVAGRGFNLFNHLLKRIKFARENNWFARKRILWFTIPRIPSDTEILVHLEWRDSKVECSKWLKQKITEPSYLKFIGA